MIKTVGHDLSAAVEQIIQLFFDLHGDFYAESTIENGTARAVVACGETGRAEYPVPENADKKTLSDCVKKSVLLACRKISKMPTPWGISTGIRPAKTARLMMDEGKTDDEIMRFMEDEYWVEPPRAKLCVDVAREEREILSIPDENSISIYVGIPFCPTRCAYCSFVSQSLVHNKKFMLPYVDACEREIRAVGEIAARLGYRPVSIYFGGGTPTAIPTESLERLINATKQAFDVSDLRELTVEAGRPDTITPEMMEMLVKNGVTRISINPQTMHQSTLDAIGRVHTPDDVVRAFELAHKAGMNNINADIILGLPDETPAMLNETLDRIIALDPAAVTVHTLYLKRAARMKSDFDKLRFAENVNEMMEICMNRMRTFGARPYYMYKQKNTLGNLENIGFAKSGAQCLYNIFIMEEVHSVFALGGGASSKLVKGDRIERIFNPKEAADYTKRIDEIIAKKQRILELLG